MPQLRTGDGLWYGVGDESVDFLSVLGTDSVDFMPELRTGDGISCQYCGLGPRNCVNFCEGDDKIRWVKGLHWS